MENLNLLFYKTFYSKLGQGKAFEKDIGDKAKALVDSKFYKEDYKPICSKIAPQKFMLKTAYPGLLVGTGYAHGVDFEDDIKVGFSFDYVTGQPYIPGSSVKGLLRAYFAHPEVIRCFLNDEELDVKALEKSIFGTSEESSEDGVDTFFDAVVKCGDEKGRVMGFDAITPHGKDLTKNPVPIKILKVMPDVVFEFSFKLEASVIAGKTVTAEAKKELFEKLLVNFGIGAKTNVGYGVLIPVGENELNVYPQRGADASNNTTGRTQYNNQSREASFSANTQGSVTELVKDKVYDCIVTGGNDYCVYIRVEGTRTKGYLDKRYLSSVTLKADDHIKASFLFTNQKGNNCFKFGSKV